MDFLITLGNQFDKIDNTQYNWIVYHFMIYLQSEVMYQILIELTIWKPKPFLFQITRTIDKVNIIVKYNSIESLV